MGKQSGYETLTQIVQRVNLTCRAIIKKSEEAFGTPAKVVRRSRPYRTDLREQHPDAKTGQRVLIKANATSFFVLSTESYPRKRSKTLALLTTNDKDAARLISPWICENESMSEITGFWTEDC